jgi:hypothetical protein
MAVKLEYGQLESEANLLLKRNVTGDAIWRVLFHLINIWHDITSLMSRTCGGSLELSQLCVFKCNIEYGQDLDILVTINRPASWRQRLNGVAVRRFGKGAKHCGRLCRVY